MADNTWMLEIVLRAPGVRHALIASTDGLVTHHSPGLERDRAEKAAALGSQYASVGKATAGEFGSGERRLLRTWIGVEDALVFVELVGEHALLMVVADAHAAPDLVNAAMLEQIAKIGAALDTAPRSGP